MSHLALALMLSAAPTADAPAVAVLEISGTGIDASMLPTLTEVLTVEIDALGTYKVIGGRDIQAMLGFEQQKDILGCTDAACLAEIGGALGVDRIVASHIGKVGKTFVVNIKLINIRMADTEARAYETVKGDVDILIGTIKKSVNKLLGPGSAAATSLGLTATAKPKPEPKPKPVPKTKPEPKTVAQADPSEPAATPAPEQTLSREEDSGLPWLAISLFGAGAVAGGVGVAFGVTANGYAEDARRDEDGLPGFDVGSQAAIGDAISAATVANIMYVVAGLAVGGGVLALILGGDDEPSSTALAPVLTPGGVGVAGTF